MPGSVTEYASARGTLIDGNFRLPADSTEYDSRYVNGHTFVVSVPQDFLQPGDLTHIVDTTTGLSYDFSYVGKDPTRSGGLFFDPSSDGGDNHYIYIGDGHLHGIPPTQGLLFATPYLKPWSIAPLAFAACYVAGTLISVPGGQARIEDLNPGDLILTQEGKERPIRWIGRREYVGSVVRARRQLQPIRVKAHALGDNLPARDLLISPAHAMLIDGLLIPIEGLVNGISIVRESLFGAVQYFHVELDTHDVLMAEGAPSETYLDVGNRANFDNGWDSKPVSGPPADYAPRVENGPAVDLIRRRLLARAGSGRPASELRGHIDGFQDGCLRGWAQNVDQPESPVCLDLMANGVLVRRGLTGKFRGDLKACGLGSGRHGFEIPFAPDRGVSWLEVPRSSDQMILDSRYF